MRTKQGGHEEEMDRILRRGEQDNFKIIQGNTDIYYTGEVTIGEFSIVITKPKRNKAPGPDEIPAELYGEMHDESEEHMTNI